MIVEQIMDVHSEEEAEDTLAGWRALPTFMVAYVRESRTGVHHLTVVGIFECADGDVKRNQKKVTSVEVRLGWSGGRLGG